MKKLVYLLTILIFTNMFAHDRHVHTYLTEEAYKLLKNHFGMDIPVMSDHVYTNGSIGPKFTNGTLTAGAWREDSEDIVYGYTTVDVFGEELSTASFSHFWDADNGDYADNFIDIYHSDLLGSIGIEDQPNSYEKIEKYVEGGFAFYFNDAIVAHNMVGDEIIFNGTTTLRYDNLVDFYLTKRIYASGTVWPPLTSGGNSYFYDGYIDISDEAAELIVWEILGRMCHLLQDMSVPAHAHVDEHGLRKDAYESWVSEYDRYKYWNATNSGNLIDPTSSSRPVHYLMYIVNQVAGHFGSSGPINAGGNDLLGGNSTPEEIAFLNAINLGSLGGPTGEGPFVDETLANIRNNTLPLVIRATAGLLYWFSSETGLINNISFKNNFNAGTLVLDNNTIASGTNKQFFRNESHTIAAVSPQQVGQERIWNQNYPNNRSKWTKVDRVIDPINIGTITTPSHTFTVAANDIYTTYVANLYKNYSVSLVKEYEFDGSVTDNTFKIVEGNSQQVTMPATSTVGNRQYYMAGWSDDMNISSSRTIQPTSNTNYSAFYKWPNYSTENTIAQRSSKKNLIKVDSDTYYLVYESAGKLWIEKSADGTNWVLSNNNKPVDILNAKNASIALEGSRVFIVYQAESSGYTRIKCAVFNVNTSVIENNYLVYEPAADSYSYNANPVISVTDNKIMTIWDIDPANGWYPNKGLYYKFGTVSTQGNIQWDSGFSIIDNTTAYSLYPDIAHATPSVFRNFHIVWQEGAPQDETVIKYIHYNEDLDIFDRYSEPSQNTGYIFHTKPSIVVPDDVTNPTPRVIWIGSSFPGYSSSKLVLRGQLYQNNQYVWNSSNFKFGYAVNDGVVTPTANDKYVVSWSEGSAKKFFTNSDWTIRNWGISSSTTLSVATAPTVDDVFSIAMVGSSAPYFIEDSEPIGDILAAKENANMITASGREGIVTKGEGQIYFSVGDVKIDGAPVNFAEMPEEVIINNASELNNYLVTESFNVNDNSELGFSVMIGVSKENKLGEALSNNDFAEYRVELFDVNTGDVLGIYDRTKFEKGNTAHKKNNSYNVTTEGIGNRKAALRLVLDENVKGSYTISNLYAEGTILGKASGSEEIAYQGEMKVTTYDLAQNYPNPFNPSTMIKYQLPEAGNVTVKIYDVLGKEVRTLVNEFKTEGKYEVEFNATGLASGVYLYHIQAGKYTATKKMMLLK